MHQKALNNRVLRQRLATSRGSQRFDRLSFPAVRRNGKCKKIEEGQECLQGMRLRQYHMLCGALLRVWKRVADTVADVTSTSILQVVRLKTKQHNKQVGESSDLWLTGQHPINDFKTSMSMYVFMYVCMPIMAPIALLIIPERTD